MDRVVIVGAGPGGLAAAYFLARAGKKPVVLEKQGFVGGISTTVKTPDGFRYDLGGHRFFTKNKVLLELIAQLLKDDLLMPVRLSRIYKQGRFFLYPIKIGDVIKNIGFFKGAGFVWDYLWAKMAYASKPEVSFEDWVVKRFGWSLYRFNFQEYTEKVWGLKPTEISADWAAERIRGLSLWEAFKDAIKPSKQAREDLATIIDRFYYPRYGIGQISGAMAQEIRSAGGKVLLDSPLKELFWKPGRVEAVSDGKTTYDVEHLVNSAPLPALLASMRPKPPEDVLRAAKQLRFRDLMIVFLKVAKKNVSNDSWIYFPDMRIPFGRWHEPKNWSKHMVPQDDLTSLPVEYFAFKTDAIWSSKDDDLANSTVDFIEKEFGFFGRKEVLGWEVKRVENAYPIWQVGYRQPLQKVFDFLEKLENLHLIGRNGRHRYNLMDHSLETGILAAQGILDGTRYRPEQIDWGKGYLESGTILKVDGPE